MRQLMHSFRGTRVPHEVLSGVASGEITAFCLFAYNVESPQQVYEMVQTIHSAARDNGHPPPIVAIDQEGGQLIAITGGTTELPGNMALGATRSPELARKAGEVLGRELLAMGINMNFAPSVDVNINPQNPVIGIRAFSDDPELVGELGEALIQGLQSQGVMASAKHFPGHGDTSNDSHHTVPRVDHPLERVNEVELKPFIRAIKAGVQSVMSSHIIYSAWDENNPATLSQRIMKDLLRDELGFTGLTLTDAMDMHAVSHAGHVDAVKRAIAAGNDLALLGHLPDQLEMMQQLKHLEQSDSVRRIDAARANLSWDFPDMTIIGCEEHQAVAREIAEKSITVVRDNGRLPLKLSDEQVIAVITTKPADLTPADTSSMVNIRLAEAITKRHPNTIALEIAHEPSAEEIAAILAATEQADMVIMGTISAEIYAGQAALVEALYQREQDPIVVSMRTPYDMIAFPYIATYLCSYGIRDVTIEAVARVLFGEITPTGQLPCDLSALIAPDTQRN